MAAKTSISNGMLFTDRRDFYIQPQVVNELYQDITPFTTLMGSLGSVSIQDPVFKQFEYRNSWLDQYVKTTAAATNIYGADPFALKTSIVLTCGSATPGLGRDSSGIILWNDREIASPTFNNSAVGLLLQYTDGAGKVINLKVVSVSGAALTCDVVGVVGYAATGANATVDAIAASSRIDVLGSAFEEGGSAPDASSDDISVIFGRTQIMKTSIEVTGTLYHMALRGYSDELARLRSEKMKEHKIQKEKTFLLGMDPKRGAVGSAGYGTAMSEESGIRYTSGVIPSILRFGKTYEATDNSGGKKANVFNVVGSGGGATTFTEFVGITENLFATLPSSSESKVFFCGAGVLSFFSNPALGLYTNGGFQINDTIKSQYGYNIRKLVTPHGEINLVHAPVLRGAWRNYGVMIDTDYVKQYTFRPTTYQANIKTDNAYDGVKDQIMSDEGIGLSMLEKHAVIKVTP